ncbi:hypothetical protein ABZ891_24825 [Streptomyces sp. NPDC047023]|uniref:hypothetical protein n=1 Tax=Streptomyces sp. NPDC047023 TaxID=3155139 RepID=UPI0033DEB48F
MYFVQSMQADERRAMDHEPLTPAAEAAIAALTELTGTTPATEMTAGALTIRADTAHMPAQCWPRLVAVLETGTSYGMTTTAAGTRTVWLRIAPGETPRP